MLDRQPPLPPGAAGVPPAGTGRSASDAEVAGLLAGRPGRVRSLVAAARRVVRELVPGCEEIAEPDWRVLSYRRIGHVCYIEPTADGALLGFYNGASLHDPRRRLRAVGTVMYHVRLRTMADLRDPAVRRLLYEASALDRLRAGPPDAGANANPPHERG